MAKTTRARMTDYASRIGGVLDAALDRGGEALLDRVNAALGVATRHLRRISAGALTLTPAVQEEIEASFARAQKMLDFADEERTGTLD